jgi:ribosomal-protein-alanine N-acetyltransferase
VFLTSTLQANKVLYRLPRNLVKEAHFDDYFQVWSSPTCYPNLQRYTRQSSSSSSKLIWCLTFRDRLEAEGESVESANLTRDAMELELSRSTIRDWRKGDEDSLVRHANNVKIWRNVRDAFPHPYTRPDAEAWIITASAVPRTSFAIEVDAEAVGGIGVVLGRDIYRRSAEMGYWLSEQYWGRGIVTEAVKAVTEYAFETFDLSRIWAGVFEWNLASARVLEKAGYTLDARLKKAAIKEGIVIDELLYSTTR